jgi:hypothetical protein
VSPGRLDESLDASWDGRPGVSGAGRPGDDGRADVGERGRPRADLGAEPGGEQDDSDLEQIRRDSAGGRRDRPPVLDADDADDYGSDDRDEDDGAVPAWKEWVPMRMASAEIASCWWWGSVAAGVMDQSRDRTVIHVGRVVADGLELV